MLTNLNKHATVCNDYNSVFFTSSVEHRKRMNAMNYKLKETKEIMIMSCFYRIFLNQIKTFAVVIVCRFGFWFYA